MDEKLSLPSEKEILEKKREYATIRKNDCIFRDIETGINQKSENSNKKLTQHANAAAESLNALNKTMQALKHATSNLDADSTLSSQSSTLSLTHQKTNLLSTHQKTDADGYNVEDNTTPTTTIIDDNNNNSTHTQNEAPIIPEQEKLSHIPDNDATRQIDALRSKKLSPAQVEKLSHDNLTPTPSPDTFVVVKPDDKTKTQPLPFPFMAKPKYKIKDLTPYSIYYSNYYSQLSVEDFDLYKIASEGKRTIAEELAISLLDDAIHGDKEDKKAAKSLYWQIQQKILTVSMKEAKKAQNRGNSGSILDEIMDNIPMGEEIAPDTPENA